LTHNELIEDSYTFICVARVRRDLTATAALSELNALQKDVSSMARAADLQAVIVPLQKQLVDRSRIGLELTFGAVATILLIACGNMINLLLARLSARRRELAIRAAIGASRARVVRQVLVEAVLIATAGGVCGVAIAYGAVQAIASIAPADVPRLDEVQMNLRLLVFAFAVSAVAGLLVGVLPALRFSGLGAAEAFTGGHRTTEGRTGGRFRSILIALEVALSAACMIIGGLLLHSFANLMTVDRGFAVDRIVTTDVTLPGTRYPTIDARAGFIRRANERLRTIPAAESIGLSNALLLVGPGITTVVSVEGTTVPGFQRPIANVRMVNPDYFPTFGIRVRSGRLFEERDGDRRVGVISISTAERAWPGQNPIGQRFRFGNPMAPLIEVVGVVPDLRDVSLDRAPTPIVYVPYWQPPFRNAALSIAVKTAGDPISLSSAIRGAIHGLDPDLPLSAFRTMQDVVDDSVSQRRFQMVLILLFAMAGILLASIGVYGVLSYAVLQRTNEIGVRLALGAAQRTIVRMVLGDALGLLFGGLAIGVPLGVGVSAAVRSLLFAVSPFDSLSTILACLMLLTAGGVAAYVPAKRASSVNPVISLRYD
jgi:putative ABC transport system permease protein